MSDSGDVVKAFGDGVREMRQRRGMSQDQLAGLSDLYATYLNEIERGKRNPSLRVVVRILDALECSLEEIIQRPQR